MSVGLLIAVVIAVRPPDPTPPPAPPPPPTGIYTAASIASSSAPAYPRTAQCAGFGGTVLLELAYDAQGAVTGVTTVKGSGHAELDQAAAEAAAAWQLRPATFDGVARPGRARVPVRFEPDGLEPCEGGARVQSARIGRKGGAGEFESTEELLPSDTVVLLLSYASAAGAAKLPIVVEWIAEGATPRVVRTDSTEAVPAGSDQVTFTLTSTPAIPDGDYSARILIEGVEQRRVRFTVGPDAP